MPTKNGQNDMKRSVYLYKEQYLEVVEKDGQLIMEIKKYEQQGNADGRGEGSR